MARITNYGLSLRRWEERGCAAPVAEAVAPMLPARGTLPEYLGKAYLAQLGIPVPDGTLARSIAEAEKIQVAPEEVEERIRNQAAHYNVSVEKMRKEIDEHDGINGLVEEILLGKTIDFLKANVSVKTGAAEQKKP